jgi:hypothetical protein
VSFALPLCLLLDYSVRFCEDAAWNREPDLLGGFQVDHQLKFRGLLHRKIGRLGPLQNLINVDGCATVETTAKRLELLKEAVPKLARISVLYDPALPGAVREMKEVLPVAARELGLTVRSWDLRDAGDFEKIFTVLNRERPDGLYVSGGPITNANEKHIAGFALKNRLPAVYGSRSGVEAGGLMSYHADRIQSPRFETMTKLQAAERQLRVAIRLFFERRDPIAVHTLATAAQDVLRRLAKPHGFKGIYEYIDDLVRPGKKRR